MFVVTGAPDVQDAVMAAAAAAGADPVICGDVTQLHRGAPGIADEGARPIVVVGLDRAHEVARAGLPARADTCLVGRADQREALCAWSAPLNATVTVLPEGIGWLTAVLAGGREGRGQVVCVLGGSGGSGSSSLAAGIAAQVARLGRRTMLVDLDPLGGGIDLLVAGEAEPGWRWPDLAAASGYLGDLRGHLPVVEEVDVLAMGRIESGGDPRAPGPGPESVAAVLASARRTHQMVVADLGRDLGPGAQEALRVGVRTLVVVVADVRGLAAAGQVRHRLGRDAEAVVRTPRPGVLDAAAVGRTLGLRVAATIGTDRRLAAGIERGESPIRAAGRRWRRSCADLAAELSPEHTPGGGRASERGGRR